MARGFQVEVFHRRGSSGESLLMTVTGPDGVKREYDRLDDVPESVRRLIEPLLQGEPPSSPDGTDALLSNESPPLPLRRKRRKLTRQARQLTYEVHWFSFLVVFGALVLFVYPLYSMMPEFRGRVPWSFWSFFKLLVALAGLYLTLAFLINRTTLTASRKTIKVRHGPLPWYGNHTLPVQDITQLYVSVRTGRYTTYGLNAQTLQGTIPLVCECGDPWQLRQIEVEIEKYLGIQDVPVGGNQYR